MFDLLRWVAEEEGTTVPRLLLAIIVTGITLFWFLPAALTLFM